jgi:cellulose synthase/poly-beta-1,6-N-acetylglucosamine synthase-like glycosyltransferase
MSCRPIPDWIANVVRCFNDPSVGCVAGDIELIPTSDNLALRYQARNDYMSPMYAVNRVNLPHLPYADGANASFRREVFERIGEFDESFFKAADVEICARLLVMTDYKIAFCRSCLVRETGEPDLRTLLHQRYRIGMGQHLMRAKYPAFYSGQERVASGEVRRRQDRSAGSSRDEPKAGVRWVYREAQGSGGDSALKRGYWRTRAQLSSISHAVRGLLRGDRAPFEDVLVRWLCGVAQDMGFSHGKRFLQEQPIQPQPIEPGVLQRFVDSHPSVPDRVVLVD